TLFMVVLLAGRLRNGRAFVDNMRLGVSLYNQVSAQTTFRTTEGMINKDVCAGDFHLEFDHLGPAGRNQHRLYISQRFSGQGAIAIGTIEYLANDVEGGGFVGATHTKEDAHRFAYFGPHDVIVLRARPGAQDR